MSERPIRSGLTRGLLGLLLLTGACTTVPDQQVGLYARAFAEAEAAGNLLYDEISPILRSQERDPMVAAASSGGVAAIEPAAGGDPLGDAACPREVGPTPFAPCFEPARFLDGGAPDEPDAVAARRRALAVITDYNRLLVRLASGAEGDAVAGEVDQLAASVGAFAGLASAAAGPLGSAVGALVGPLAGMVRNIQAAEEVRRAAVDGAPVVERLLDALIADTRRMYAIKREDAVGRSEDLEFALKDEVQFAAEDLMSAHARPADTTRLDVVGQRINTAFARAGLPPVALVALAGETGSAPFDARLEQELDGLAARAEELADAHQAELSGLDAYYRALGEYVVLLDRTGDALDQVVAAAKAPRSVTVDAAAVASQTADITLQAREVRRLLDGI